MNFLSMDIETYEKEGNEFIPILDTNKFALGCIMDKNKKERFFYSSRSMYKGILSDIEKSKTILYYYGHNMEYDFYGVFKEYMKELITLNKLKIICTRPFIAIYGDDLEKKPFDVKAYFLDSMSFYFFSLKDVGEMIGNNKLEMPSNPRSLEEIKPYLFKDCEIVIDAIYYMINTMKELGFNPRKYITASSLSMNCFISYITKNDKSGWILNKGRIHKDVNNLEFIRQSNRGGYNMAFQIGSFKDCVCVDINSSYWRSMHDMRFPDLLKERRLDRNDIYFIGYKEVFKYIGVSKCKIKCPKTNIGVLGVRYRSQGKSIYHQHFPRNEEIIIGTWTHNEINYAIECGYEVLDVYESVIWLKELKFNPLKDYINILWNKRINTNDKCANHFIKILGNGLYGKLMQRKVEKDYKWVKREDIDRYIENGWKIESCIDDYCISKEKEPYIPKYLSLILGSIITADARISLIKGMKKIPFNDLLYCDTDSIVFKGRNLDKVNIGNGLGEFKIEEKGDCIINGEKKYSIGEKISIAGLPKRQRNKDVLIDEKEIEIDKMVGYKQSIHFGGFEKTGTFYKEKKRFEKSGKKDVILPKEIIEEEL